MLAGKRFDNYLVRLLSNDNATVQYIYKHIFNPRSLFLQNKEISYVFTHFNFASKINLESTR